MGRLIYIVRQTAYTLFSFAYFLVAAADLTARGFFLLTVGGKSEANKLRFHEMLQRRAQFVINRVPGTMFRYINNVGETFSRPAVIVSNHQSHLDLMAIIMLNPKIIILTKGWVWHNPFYGLIIRYADYLPTGDNEWLLTKIKERMAQGYYVMVFPEGTRSADCTIQRFHRGAFYMAEQLDVDILPIFIKGFGTVLPKTSFHLHPGEMSLEVLPRIGRNDVRWQVRGYKGMTKAIYNLYKEKNGEA